MLYLDERADPNQQRALEEIWTGRVAGEQLEHFPWAWKASNLVGVKPAQIEIDHTPRRQWFRVRDVVSVRISGPYPGDETVTCVIPGHERAGEEMIAERAQGRRRTAPVRVQRRLRLRLRLRLQLRLGGFGEIWLSRRAALLARRRATFRQTLPFSRVNPYRILSDRTLPAHGRGFDLGV